MVAVSETDIAVIGMSCRFPGAGDPASFWRNLVEGRESITFFSPEELAAAGLARSLYDRPDYVRARGVLPGIERFDAAFFDMTPAEAAMTDPQHRLFLECAWEAMEDGGYHGGGFAGPIGVYGGCGAGGYLRDHVLPQAGTDLAGLYQIMQANEKDFLATRTAYKLHLTGPAITVQTACSTSLVAVHCACQAILNGECDMALAGGVSIFLPQTCGYLYQEGMILSVDGHCRAFDASAGGTVMGSGAGLVLMKRLEDAIHDRDFIYGVIKGSAVNNDGAGKVGFAAPGVDGQVRAIREALAVAGVDPADIGYVETHGTATPMGDPVEIEALSRAFGRTNQRATCLIGSVKTNIGHCDAAAGIAGLIKTLLALQNGRIPPSLHFVKANPAIDFGSSPFRVCTVPTTWPSAVGPRLAGVSSFGMGGTNVHMIVQEAPARGKLPSRRGCCLLPISGKTATALAKTAGRLAHHIDTHPEDDLPDIAFSLQVGRQPLNCRNFIVAGSGQEASAALVELELHGAGHGRRSSLTGMVSPAIAFMFPGQGSQYVGMAREIYAGEKGFRAAVDLCAETLNPLLDRDLRHYLTSSDTSLADELQQTAIAQPVLFAVEYGYAMLLSGWGIRPQAVIGHSLGEYVAACLAGVFTLADVLQLVAARGALMQRQPRGMMVAVARSAEELTPLVNVDVALAAVNPGSCTLSGPSSVIRQLVARFAAEGVAHSVLKTSHAFHSAMFDAAMAEFAAIVATVPRSAPRIPLISNLTGGLLSDREAIDPWYWARHLRHTVRFGDGVNTLLTEPGRLLVEVGPGRTLAGMAMQGGLVGANRKVVGVGCNPRDGVDSSRALLSAVGEMWALGVPVDWQALAGEDKSGRLPLPTYPFEREEYWMDAPARGLVEVKSLPTPEGRLSTQQWRRLPHLAGGSKADSRDRWILIADPGPVADDITRILAGRGCRPTLVAPAETSFDFISDEVAVHLVYLPSLQESSSSSVLPEQALSFTIGLAGALERLHPAGPVFCDILTFGVYDITGDEQLVPSHGALAAAVHSLGREYPALCCRCLDCGMANTGEPWPESRVETLVRELMHPGERATIALRGGHRWQEYYESVAPLAVGTGPRRHGTWLITGGLGDIGLALADHLTRHFQANLVLTRKSPFPAPEKWPAWLAEHGENEATSGVIRRLLSLQERGSAILAVAADVAGREEMQEVIDLAESRFGRIDGCIHGAGVTGAEAICPYRELTLDRFAAILSAKLSGYQILRELLRGRNPDFLIAMSSLSAVLGGSGMGAYGAANAAMAAQIGADNRNGGRWLCIDWDGWRFDEWSTHSDDDNDLLKFTIPASAGVDHLARLAQWTGGGRIAVSTTDLNDRARRWSPGSTEPRREPPVLSGEDDAGRETLSPEEELVAGVWRNVLGTPSIRRHDSFFGLGGSSLQITQVHSRLKESLGLDFPLRHLFEAPRLVDMAELVCRQMGRVAEDSPASREEMEF